MSIPAQRKECLYTGKKAGFMLAEILVALLIFVGLSTVVLHYQWYSARLYVQAEKKAAALTVITNVLEEYAISGILPANGQQIDDITVSWKYVPVFVQMQAPFLVLKQDTICNMLHVTGQWCNASDTQTLTIVAGKNHA